MTLTGDVVARGAAPWRGATGADAVATARARCCAGCVAAAERPVIGVGIASPGVIDDDGLVLEAPNRGWYDVPLAADLAAALGAARARGQRREHPRPSREFTYGGADRHALMVVTVGAGRRRRASSSTACSCAAAATPPARSATSPSSTRRRRRDPAAVRVRARGCLETVLSVPALRRRTPVWTPRISDAALASVGTDAGRRPGTRRQRAQPRGDPALAVRRSCSTDRCGRRRSTPSDAGPCRPSGTDLELRMASLDEDAALAGAAVLVLSGQLGVS